MGGWAFGTLNFPIAVVLGAAFGWLFQGDVRSYGSSLGWGLAYGMLWWFLGPLTLLPAVQGRPVDWTAAHATTTFGQLIGYVIFGLLMGLVYGLINRFWLGFFVEADPINREVEGPARRTLQALVGGHWEVSPAACSIAWSCSRLACFLTWRRSLARRQLKRVSWFTSSSAR